MHQPLAVSKEEILDVKDSESENRN